MLSCVAGALFLLLLESGYSFKRGVGETQQVGGLTPPPLFHPRKQPSSHISEFTDPDTGLNPFLDLEEGRAADMGRNPADTPFQPVEGDSTPSKRKLPEAHEPSWLWHFEDNLSMEDMTTESATATPIDYSTTTFVGEEVISERWSSNAIVAASLTTSAVVLVVIMTSACWWRRRLKRTARSPSAAENGDCKISK